MAVGRGFRLSANLCVFLCIYVALNVIGFHTRGRTPYQTTEKHFSFHRSIAGLKLQELHFAEVNRPVGTSLIEFERA